MSDRTYTVRLLERVNHVPEGDWDALLSEESSPFVEHRWLDMLEETGCVGQSDRETGWLPAHLSIWRSDKLVAVAPSYLKGHSEGEFVFDWSWADFAQRVGIRYYPKVVIAVPFTPATGDRVLVAPGEDRTAMTNIVARAAREWCESARGSSVHVLFPRKDEADAWESSGYLRRASFQFHWFREDASKFEDYLARFNSKRRNQIKREIRGIGESGLTVSTLSPDEHTVEIARTMHALYASTIDKHGVWGRLYLNARFFESVVERFRDRLAWVVARDSAGTIVAGAFNVVRGRRLYGRYWGARTDVPFLHFGVCYYAGIRYCIENGVDAFEPGAGGEHKRARGFVPTLTHSAHWVADPRLRAALRPWLDRERSRVHQLVETGGDDDSP